MTRLSDDPVFRASITWLENQAEIAKQQCPADAVNIQAGLDRLHEALTELQAAESLAEMSGEDLTTLLRQGWSG